MNGVERSQEGRVRDGSVIKDCLRDIEQVDGVEYVIHRLEQVGV